MICPRCHSTNTTPALVRGKQSIGYYGGMNWCNKCGFPFGDNYKPKSEDSFKKPPRSKRVNKKRK